MMGPEDGGDDAGGAPGKPPKPPKPPEPPLGMGGEGGAASAECPLQAPSHAAACTTAVKCDYQGLTCDCGGPEADRRWKCKEPPKPMTMCPPMAPKEASACVTKDVEPPPPPCSYEEPAVECKCTADKWACTVMVAP